MFYYSIEFVWCLIVEIIILNKCKFLWNFVVCVWKFLKFFVYLNFNGMMFCIDKKENFNKFDVF